MYFTTDGAGLVLSVDNKKGEPLWARKFELGKAFTKMLDSSLDVNLLHLNDNSLYMNNSFIDSLSLRLKN